MKQKTDLLESNIIPSNVPVSVALQNLNPPPISESAALIQVIERAAMNPNVDVEKMERLFAMHERILLRQREQKYHEAMKEAQAEMRPVATDANNPQTRSKYASYFALDRALRPIYVKHGFALDFNTEPSPENVVRVVCSVMHDAGHSKSFAIDMPADGKGAKGGDVMTKTHAVGSAVSYGMRNLLKMVFNIAIGDDDGVAAGAGELITEDQVADLQAMIEDVGADKAKFLVYLKIASLADLPAKKFKNAVEALKAKGAK